MGNYNNYRSPSSAIAFSSVWIRYWINVACLCLDYNGSLGISGLCNEICQRNDEGGKHIYLYDHYGLLMVPIPLYMTDYSKVINLIFSGMYLTFFIKLLNSLGALFYSLCFQVWKGSCCKSFYKCCRSGNYDHILADTLPDYAFDVRGHCNVTGNCLYFLIG